MVGPINSVNPGAWRAWQSENKRKQGKNSGTLHSLQDAQAKAGDICTTVCKRVNGAMRDHKNYVASFAAGIAVATIATSGTVALIARANTVPSVPLTLTTPMTVKPGDTLWSLAQKYGHSGEHIQNRVQAVAKANGMSRTSTLVPGQRLLIPVSNPIEVARLQSRTAKRQ
jgi:LysM repeat protein